MQQQMITFDTFTVERDKKKVKLKPKFQLVLRELIQNIPWSASLTKVIIRLTRDPGSGLIILQVLDADIGCDYNTFYGSVLTEETADKFLVDKKFANKFGQGLLNLVSYSKSGNMNVYMKKDGVTEHLVINHDIQRSTQRTTNPTSSPLDNLESGFCVEIPLDISKARSFGIKSEDDLAKLFYDTLKFDLHFNLNRVSVEFDLVGFDKFAYTNMGDHAELIPKKSAYVILTDFGAEVSDKPQHITEIDKVWEEPVTGQRFTISKIEYGKRLGSKQAAKIKSITEEQFRKEYFLADFKYYQNGAKPLLLGDKPIALLVCNRTNLILGYIILRSGSTGQENRNHVTMFVFIDIQDDVWGTEQTKEELMSPELKSYVTERLSEIVDTKYPPDKYKEQSMHCYMRHLLVKGTDHNAQALFAEMGKPEWFELSEQERLLKIGNEVTKGKVRFDFSFHEEVEIDSETGEEKKSKRVPIELKPKPFDVNAFRQGLEQIIISKDSERALFIGLDLTDKHIDDFYNQENGRFKDWVDGKLPANMLVKYIDLRKFGYNEIQEASYLKQVRDAHRLNKKK